MKFYKIEKYRGIKDSWIEAVEVERATEQSIWIKGRRVAMVSDWSRYFPTWADAHQALMTRCTSDVNAARSRLTAAEAAHAEVSALKEPQ